MNTKKDKPLVTIILPVYNRAIFLTSAIQSIRTQTLKNWELIIVDDGSTDNTLALLPKLIESIEQPVRLIQQDNKGAYGARNTGLEHANGDYIAFYDSDDIWLPHHLNHCASALDANKDVDWVFAACRIINLITKETVSESSFYEGHKPRPFMKLLHQQRGSLRVITDKGAAACQIQHGLYCGLQNSVIRSSIFSGHRFEWESRNEAEDQIFAIQSLSSGKRLAYLDAIHVDYHIHDSNSSNAGSEHDLERKARVTRAAIQGFEKLLREGNLPTKERQRLQKKLGNLYFWRLGYTIEHQAMKATNSSLESFKNGLKHDPRNLRMWKTFLINLLRSKVIRDTVASQ